MRAVLPIPSCKRWSPLPLHKLFLPPGCPSHDQFFLMLQVTNASSSWRPSWVFPAQSGTLVLSLSSSLSILSPPHQLDVLHSCSGLVSLAVLLAPGRQESSSSCSLLLLQYQHVVGMKGTLFEETRCPIINLLKLMLSSCTNQETKAQREEVTCLRSHSERRTSWHSNSLWDQWANILLVLTLTHSFLRIAFGHLFFFFQVNTYCGITEMQKRAPKCVVNEFSQQNTPMEPILSSRNKRGYMYTTWNSLH